MTAVMEFRVTVLDELTQLLDMVEAFGEAQSLPMGTVMTLNLVLEELVTNAMTHGSEAGGAVVSVSAALEGDRILGTVRDNGRAFNPLEHREPDTTLPLEDREIGGLGLYLVRQMAQGLDYKRVGAENVLNFQLSVQEG